MRIVVVVVAHNRPRLLRRALLSITKQRRSPDSISVISNSSTGNTKLERTLCSSLGIQWVANQRTPNYAGALNQGIEDLVKSLGIAGDIFFASLDDDDAWDPDYLHTLEANSSNEDILLANIVRVSGTEKEHLHLPMSLDQSSFLRGNPGVGGSNTFVRLRFLLTAGGFDEAMPATIDRDLFTRLFQLKPKYKIIPDHLVYLYVEKGRERVTTNRSMKKESYRYFFYKYQNAMTPSDQSGFLERAEKVFCIEKSEVKVSPKPALEFAKYAICFEEKGDYPFVIGFIAGEKLIAERIIDFIYENRVPLDLLLIVNNLPPGQSLNGCCKKLSRFNVEVRVVEEIEWSFNLKSGVYGSFLKRHTKINSIPLGRTILQFHLYTETADLKDPVFWIVDDDISFTTTSLASGGKGGFDIFGIVNEFKDKSDALIGSVSQDPPLPFFSCMRGQLVDLLYSSENPHQLAGDFNGVGDQRDYYYDITDAHTNHLESPIYFPCHVGQDLRLIFSGKATSRPCFQRALHGVIKEVSNRGPNTLIFNRELLKSFPVVNLEVNNKFVRRGDLTWALMSQHFSAYTFVEHTMSVDQNRPLVPFDMRRELDKSANDLIGYAFNKAFFRIYQLIKTEYPTLDSRQILALITEEQHWKNLFKEFRYFLKKREARFLMNYCRIIGVLQLLERRGHALAQEYLSQFSDEALEGNFSSTLHKALNERQMRSFVSQLPTVVHSFSHNVFSEVTSRSWFEKILLQEFGIKSKVSYLGQGSEGIVCTDKESVYKLFYAIQDSEWDFLKKLAKSFHKCTVFYPIVCEERGNLKLIRYPFEESKVVNLVSEASMVFFLRFCKENRVVYTNIKPENFIHNRLGAIKLIDYGRSFEVFTETKFLNSVQRAFLYLNYPSLNQSEFEKLTAAINQGNIPPQIKNWQTLLEKT